MVETKFSNLKLCEKLKADNIGVDGFKLHNMVADKKILAGYEELCDPHDSSYAIGICFVRHHIMQFETIPHIILSAFLLVTKFKSLKNLFYQSMSLSQGYFCMHDTTEAIQFGYTF